MTSMRPKISKLVGGHHMVVLVSFTKYLLPKTMLD